jgi:hypothetical protein
MSSQLAAGAVAALLVRAFVGPATPAVLGSEWKILLGELIFTLALAYVVLNVTSAEATEGSSFYGLAISTHPSPRLIDRCSRRWSGRSRIQGARAPRGGTCRDRPEAASPTVALGHCRGCTAGERTGRHEH